MSNTNPNAPSNPNTARTMLRMASASALWFNLLTLVVLAGATLLLHFVLKGRFDELDIELPAITSLLFDTPPWQLLAGYAMVGVVLIAKEKLIRSKAAALLLNLFSIALLAGMVLALALAIFLPLQQAMLKLAS